MIDNPEYKGPWKPKMIDNPEYKGEWEHPMIPNPDYVEDSNLYMRCEDCKYVGFELWQVKSGTLFDDIIVTDSIDEAKKYAEKTFLKKKDAERAAYDKMEEEKKKAAKPEEEEEEDEDDERDEL